MNELTALSARPARRIDCPAVTSTTPLVSIGLLTYKVASPDKWRWFTQAIDSILAQTFQDFDLVISDNHSADGTHEKLQERFRGNPRVTILEQRRTYNPQQHYNHVFHSTRGKYFLFVADHDLYAPTFLEKTAAALERDPELALVYPRTCLIGPDDTPLRTFDDALDTRGLGPRDRFSKTMWTLVSCNQLYGLLRSESLEKTDCAKTFVRGVDHLILAELSLHGAIMQLPEALYFRRVNRNLPPAEQERRVLDASFRPQDPFLKLISFCHLAWAHMVVVEMSSLSPADKDYLLNDVANSFVTKFGPQMRREAAALAAIEADLQQGRRSLSPKDYVKFAEARAVVDLFRARLAQASPSSPRTA